VDDHLNRYEIDLAILNPGSTLYLSGLPDIELANEIARATNDWTVEEWFPADDRFLGSILISPRDPEWSAAEIRRLGDHPRMVQVTTNWVPSLLGARQLHPIYEACDEKRLPFNLHVGGAGAGINQGSYGTGNPTTFLEGHFGMCVPALQHLVSLVTEGVFVKFPNFRFVLNEFGVTWLPFVLWRLDQEFRENREDVPWLEELPSEYISRSVRFTTQPLETPADPRDLITLLSVMGGDHFLMFSSDYPHWDFDNPQMALKGFPPDWLDNVFFGNAWDFYGLDRRLSRALPAGDE
jgi:hypothetical protein